MRGRKRKFPEGTVRMTITLPVALRRRMVEVEELFNWSALAAEAFRYAVATAPCVPPRHDFGSLVIDVAAYATHRR